MIVSSTRTHRRRMFQGASALTLAVAAIVSEQAHAQATPGSPQCPVVDGVVTCSGAIPEGVVIVEGDNVGDLRVRDLTVPIAPATGRGGIDFRRATGPVSITTLAGPNGITVRDTGDGIVAQSAGAITIDNALNIAVTPLPRSLDRRPGTAGIRTVLTGAGGTLIRNSGTIDVAADSPNADTPTGAIVAESRSGGSIAIENSGAIAYRRDANNTGSAFSYNGFAILAYLSGSQTDSVTIRNSGAITLNEVDAAIGVFGEGSGSKLLRSLSVSNSGAITGTGSYGIDLRLLTSGIRPVEGSVFSIENNGTIALSGNEQGFDQAGILVDLRSSSLPRHYRVSVRNEGDILFDSPLGTSPEFHGILVEATGGSVSVFNSGRIALNGTDRDERAQGINVKASDYAIDNRGDIATDANFFFGSAGIYAQSAEFGVSTGARLIEEINRQSNLRNSGTLTLTGSVNDGLEVFHVGVLDLVNSGRIDVAGERATGMSIYSLTQTMIDNSGTISTRGVRGHGVYLSEISQQSDEDLAAFGADAVRDLKGTIVFSTSGAISAVGMDADGIRVSTGVGSEQYLGNAEDSAEFCDEGAVVFCSAGARLLRDYDGTVTINVAANGSVSGGAGTGAGVSLFGIGNHILDNSGTITALSGRGVVGGVGRDTVINRGTILATVALGDNDDRFVLTATANLPVTDGGAGTDTFALEAASGSRFAFDVSRATTLTGFERFAVQGAGLVSLTGAVPAALPRALFVEGGTASIDTDLTGFSAQVASGATLAGTGSLGATTIADGGVLSPGGDAVGTLSLGSLSLSAGSSLRFDLGRPDRVGGTDNDLMSVAGNLVLDGTLNVIAQPQFGDGVYRLINYGGSLTDNGLAISALPGGSTGQIQTVIGGQINLVVGSATQFWDGTDTSADLNVDGGSGVWNNTTTNWTRRGGDVNETWGSAFAVFQGAPGTVTIAPEGVSASGMQFAIDGYRVDGGALTLTAPATLRVGDGSAGGADYSATIASAIGGVEGLEKTDLGTLILSGANGYAGGTRITGGVLSVGADGALGSGGLTLNGGALRTTAGLTSGRAVAVTMLGGTIDTAAGTLALSGLLSGNGTLSKAGAGMLTLSGDAAGFTGTTNIAAGTLDLRTTLGGTLNVASGGTLAGTGSAGATSVADGGTLTPGGAGVGTLTLASLSLSPTARLAFGLGTPGVVGGTTNDLVRVTGNLVLDGTLDVTVLPGFGEGVYRLFDYGGALTDNGLALGSVPGAAQVQTILPGQVNLVVGTALQYWDGAGTTADLRVGGGSGTWSNTTTNWTRVGGDVNESWGRGFAVFQGAPGTVTITPEGVAATGLQFAIDGYRIEGGPLTLNAPATLRVGDGSAGGAGYSATIASSIAGTGGVFKTDLGTLILTGTNSYTGGTSVNGGVLQVTGDTNLGAATGGVTLDGGTLRLAGALTSARGFTIGAGGGTLDTQANAVTLSGTLGGSGTFTKTGSGTLGLGGNSAAFTGTTRIASGTLALTGTLGGPLSIASGATLTGTGRAAGLDLAGTVAPGNSPDTLTITGDALFRAGSIYQVDLAGNGATDLIQVGGAAVIQGGSVAINQLDPRSAYTDGAVYRILDAAGGRTGTFSSVTRNSLLFGFTLGYDPTGAFVTARAITTTYNQGQTALGLEAFDRTAGSDGAGVFNALLALDTVSLRAALDASSGEIYAGLLGDALGSGTARADRLVARANTPAPEGWGMWGGLDGRTGRINGDGNAARLEHSGYGFDLGIDYRGVGNAWAVGVGGGYVHASLDLDARSSRSRSSGWQIGGYARYGTGGAGITASVAANYQHQDADITRAIAFAGVDRAADGRASVKGGAVTGELRYGVAASDAWSLGPTASVHYAHASIDDIRETGPAALALTGRGADDRTRYGGGAFVNWQSGRSAIDLSAQYVGGNSDPANVGLAFAGSPANAFDIRAPRIRGSAALVNLGTRYDLGGGWSLAGDARATVARDQRSLSANATLGWRF